MSVPAQMRQEGTLQVLNHAAKLCAYTLGIIRNESCFPKRTRWQLPSLITHECISMYIDIRSANKVRVCNHKTYDERCAYQRTAAKHLEALYGLIDLAYQDNKLPSNKVEYWTGLCVQTEDALRKWSASDRKRYKEYCSDEGDALTSISAKLDTLIDLLQKICAGQA